MLSLPPRPPPQVHPFDDSDAKFASDPEERSTSYQPLDASHFWPGGIPASVKLRSGPNLSEEQFVQECQAWILFVSEDWVTFEAAGTPGSLEHYCLNQRRELVVRWAEADQSFRDSYADRAPVSDPNFVFPVYPFETMWTSKNISHRSFVVLPKVDQSEAPNFVHWVKMLLLLHRFHRTSTSIKALNLNFDRRDCYLKNWSSVQKLIFAWDTGSEDSVPPHLKEDAAQWLFLENADFDNMCMTRDGQVVITYPRHMFMIDQRNLDEGSLSIIDFKQSGQIGNELRIRPWHCNDEVLLQCQKAAWAWEELCEQGLFDIRKPFRVRNRHHDWDAPVLAMMESARAEPLTEFDDNLDQLVEYYAPGYLALEAEGRETEYDTTSLLESVFGNE